MQDTNTKHMVFNTAEQIAYLSSVTTLSPGDVIATGTGAGVGMAKNIKVQFGEMHKVLENMLAGKARMLRPGDTVAIEVEGVGRLENTVAAA
jgi:2-keto-4-pentenoate hydratase/2-oxohepta-3-ene-1,7-dioic acid hydratase in catechol pathway